MLAPIILSLCGCSTLYMTRLPLQCQVVDQTTRAPMQNVSATLVWRVGFGGITWGKPAVFLSDSNGMIRATAENIPALASTGYALKRPLRKIMIDRLTLKADGYETLYLEDYKVPSVVQMRKTGKTSPDEGVAH